MRLLVFLLLLPSFCVGQNLVPNPSFENVNPCPTAPSQIVKASPWFAPNPNPSSDVYHQCGFPPLLLGVPTNQQGYQQANTGVAYAGIIHYATITANYREYIAVRLTDSLIKDSLYSISFYHNFADESVWAVNRLGATLSKDTLWQNILNTPLTNIPTIQSDTALMYNDSINWVQLIGTYCAQGGEQYITIGSFYYDSVTTIQAEFGGSSFAYYYIDDVSVTLEGSCLAEGVSEGDSENILIIYPNPTTGIFTVQGGTGEIQVYDMVGCKVLVTTKEEIDLSSYAKGIYLVRVGEAVRKIVIH